MTDDPYRRPAHLDFVESILENLPSMVFVKDAAELRLVFVNRAGEELLGFDRHELLGRNDYDSFPAEQADAFTADDRAVLARRELVDIPEEPVETRHRGRRLLHTRKIPILGEGGEPKYLLGISEDITEHRATQSSLDAALAEAERANRTKSEFLSRMSHELRTPLNVILGFSQLLQAEDLAAEQLQTVNHVYRAGKHLLELINEVLEISRVESGQLALSIEPVDLAEVQAEVVSLVAPLAATRSIRLPEVSLAGHLAVRADRQRLRQVLLNFATNAVKYNRDGGQVNMSSERTGDGRVRVLVSDTGPGIPLDRVHRLFTPFDRLGAEESGVEGTGLGLALSKYLVEAMGGTIGVDSQPGVGCTFFVELERADKPVAPPSEPELADVEPGGTSSSVLYIEDNPANVLLVSRILERRPNTSLLTAYQGRLGIELARQHRPDLILLDVNLPDLGGEDVLGQLSADPRTAGIPVIVVSADAMPEQRRHLLAAGAREYVTKPFALADFLRAVDDGLAAGRPDDRPQVGGDV